MSKKCIVCDKELRLFKKANYSSKNLSSYTFASRKTPDYMHWDLYECKTCRILYSSCEVEREEIDRLYKTASYDSSTEANCASLTYAYYLKKKLPNFPNGKALDIGTGNGSYLSLLIQLGMTSVTGVEPSQAPIEAASNEIKEYIINT